MGFEERLNEFYKGLDTKAERLKSVLIQAGFKAGKKYFNGHYNKDATGKYVMDYYPIPVIEVENLCDIEIDGNHINISTKLEKSDAVKLNHELLNECYYEVYGVIDYLSDYYKSGEDISKLYKSLDESKENEIGYAFSFPSDVDLSKALYVVIILRDNGFYY